MANEKTKLEEMQVTYMGKELKKKTDTWKLWKLKFNTSNDKQITGTCFDNIGIKKDGTKFCKTIKELEEGELYNIQFELHPWETDKGETAYTKNIKFIHEPREIKKVAEAQKELKGKVLPVKAEDRTLADKICEHYKAKVPEGKRKLGQFMGYFLKLYIKNNDPKLYKFAEDLYNEIANEPSEVDLS